MRCAKGSVVYYLHGDHLGSTSLTTNASGAEVARQLYYPYGEVRWPTGGSTLPTDYTFTGQRNESSFDLMDYNARYYDPYLNRFISPDTIIPDPANPQSFNRYAYCLNNPLKYNDPSGFDPLDAAWEQEFRTAHDGRDPDEYDRLLRLFSIAYPDEWGDGSQFYDSDGNYIQGSLEAAFREYIPDSRTWDSIPDALSRMAGWYTGDETEMFVRDIGFLFSGLKSRFVEPSMHKAVTDCASGYRCANQGNLLYTPWVWVRTGSFPDYLTTSDAPEENNMHHWGWAVVLGYHRPMLAPALNTFREYAQTGYLETGVSPYSNPFHAADVYMGNRGAAFGANLRIFGHSHKSIAYFWRQTMMYRGIAK